jgi:uncharacterized protein (TIGR01777 family)
VKILVTGATGLIGRKLIYKLMISGHEVLALARSPEKLPELPEKNIFQWTDDRSPQSSWFAGCDAVVNLAGEGIANQKWTKERKQKIWTSRVLGTQRLVTAMSSLSSNDRPKVLISASAIGHYPSINDAQDEDSKAGSGFLSDLCSEWEKEANKALAYGIRTVNLRTGLVLSKHGGVLAKSGPVILGSGKQWMSWIHIEDMVTFILHVIENTEVIGPYNLTAPNPVTNEEFTRTVASAMGFPFTIKIPQIVLRAVLGELSTAVLSNQKIMPKRTISSGFNFKFENLKSAIADLIGETSLLDNHLSLKQFIPSQRGELFPFFGKAENLEILTPPWLNFQITKKSTAAIQKGTLIDYKLKIHGFPVKWQTLISNWAPEEFFVDEQLKGPYKKWHHVHSFEPVPGGTLISDEVTFRLPGWFFGKVILPLVLKDVYQIFKYRQEKIKMLYSQGALKCQ